MRRTVPLTLDLPVHLHAALCRAAERNGRNLPREAVEVLRRAFPEHPARTSVRTEERLLAPVRALLAGDIAKAQGWGDLQARLRTHGFAFRERGGGLALFRLVDGARVCKASELGASYADLVRRFGAAFPGHAHTRVAQRVLDQGRRRTPPPPAGPGPAWDDDDDPVLIEDA